MTVDISVDETPAQPTSTPVVIVEDDNDASLPAVIDHAERITLLESRIAELESRVMNAQFTAEVAQESAEEAGNIAVAALDTAIEAETLADEVAEIAIETADETGVLPEVFEEVDPQVIEPDVTPRSTHWLYRDVSEWRQRLGKS